MNLFCNAIVGLVLILASCSVRAVILEIGPTSNFHLIMANLNAGDELILRGGIYQRTSAWLGLSLKGTPTKPIVIRAKRGEQPVFSYNQFDQNLIQILDSQHLTIDGLELTGGSHGIRVQNSNHITLKNLLIHHVGDNAISINFSGSSYRDIVIEHNEIHHTGQAPGGFGEAMYLGCENNACTMSGSTISNNYIHHTNGGNTRPGAQDGIEIKPGSYNNIIKDNVIHDAAPCIITHNTGNNAINIIEGNALWNCTDHGIQAEADATIASNLIFNVSADAIHNREHKGVAPRNLKIVNNTIITAGTGGIRIRSPQSRVSVANNAIYSQNAYALQLEGNTSLFTVANNLGQGGTIGVNTGFNNNGNINQDFESVGYPGSLPLSLFPGAQSHLIGAGNTNLRAEKDFNGIALNSNQTDIGAYKWNKNGNAGWVISESFKQLNSINPNTGSGQPNTLPSIFLLLTKSVF